jgi:hypothetical protein
VDIVHHSKRLRKESVAQKTETKYPLIDGLYAKMVEIFNANTPDDDHIYVHPEGALDEAAREVIGDDDDSEQKFLAIVRESLALERSGESDDEASDFMWGICAEGGEDNCHGFVAYYQLVVALFKPSMREMIQRRDPNLIEEGQRKTEQWEARLAR